MELLVLNTDFKSIAVIDTYESMIWTDRYNSYGDFEIFFAMDTQLLQYLKEDYYLWLKDSEHCMIIEDIKINADTEEGNHLIVTGRSLESILERRIIWGQRIFNGNLQNGIQTMLNECIISPSIADRKISNFVFVPSADPKITSLKIDNQYTGDCLYDVIKGLCEENNIGFKIVLTDENKFAFSLYAGVDRSYEQTENPYVVFSPNFENIINSNYYSSRASFRNVTLVAGEGEGAARRTAIVGSASGLDRRELFTDARDISSDTEDGTLSDAEYITSTASDGRTLTKTFSDGFLTMTNDITRLDGILAGIGGTDEEATVVAYVTKMINALGIGDYVKTTTMTTELGKKVDKVEGSRLMTNAEGTKLAGIAAGAQANVIEKIKVNRVEATPAAEDKSIALTIPTGKLAGKDIVAETDLDAALKEKVNAAAEGNHSHANKAFLDTLSGATDEEVTAMCTEVFGA